MPNQACSVAICLVIAFAMMFGFLRPFGYSASHDPSSFAAVSVERHDVTAGQIEDHGHDDGVADKQSPGHVHAHNPADHSHETASTLAVFEPAFPQVHRSWLIYPPTFADPDATFRLDRPPRPYLAA